MARMDNGCGQVDESNRGGSTAQWLSGRFPSVTLG
jgi:hypothetical protein